MRYREPFGANKCSLELNRSIRSPSNRPTIRTYFSALIISQLDMSFVSTKFDKALGPALRICTVTNCNLRNGDKCGHILCSLTALECNWPVEEVKLLIHSHERGIDSLKGEKMG